MASRLLAEGPEPIHHTRRKMVTATEILDDVPPRFMVQGHLLEDGLDVGRNGPAFIITHRPARPVRPLRVIQQGEGDTPGRVGMVTADKWQ